MISPGDPLLLVETLQVRVELAPDCGEKPPRPISSVVDVALAGISGEACEAVLKMMGKPFRGDAGISN